MLGETTPVRTGRRAAAARWLDRALTASIFGGRTVLHRFLRADLANFDGLPYTDASPRDRQRRAVLYASLRLRGAEGITRARIRYNAILFVAVLSTSILIARLRDAIGDYAPPPVKPSSQQTDTYLGPVNALILGIGIAVLCASVLHRFLKRRPRLIAFPSQMWAAQSTLPGLSAALTASLSQRIGIHSTWGYFWNGLVVTWNLQLLYLAITAGFGIPVSWAVARRCRPTDRLLLETTALAADVHARTRRRRTREAPYLLCRRLDHLALMAEHDLVLPYQGPRTVRRELRQPALRIAAVYRQHRLPLITASTPEAADRVVASLMAAAEALATGDRAALLANAPDHVNERNIFRRLVTRLWPAALFVTAGALLPLIPSIATQSGVASSLRWSLIVAGVLTFVAGQDTATRIGTPLDKALPWRA
ncbi:hypothetical protein [Actinacidiphila acidipaludis]|uniref:Integral membrane protein n=1 Tax=Actinacidiphila acidipaludis TaxID=2873382 RepID=A0ABS7Q2M3_9ACTN|nr:hypothetical protein [Streptomyces acidipaludis]MBY8877392.1 hypothetical protein [Streptomyces acidipaludis]